MASIQIPSSQQAAVDQGGLFLTSWFMYFQGIYKAIRSPLKLKLTGLLNIDTTSNSNSGSAQTDLTSYSLQNNVMVNNGDILEIRGSGIFASNAHNKTITLEFGSQEIYNSTALAINGGSWSIYAEIVRLSPTTQEINVEALLNGTATTTRTAGTQNLNNINTIKFAGTGTSSDDIIQLVFYSKLTPND